MEMSTRTFDVRYLETWLPPRCRKLRYRVVEEAMTFGIPAYSAEEASVAFRVCSGGANSDIRWDGSRCYMRMPGANEGGDWADWLRAKPSVLDGYEYYKEGSMIAEEPMNGREELASEVGAILDGVCLVEGELWKACGEPGFKPEIRWGDHRRYAALRVSQEPAAEWNALQGDEAMAAAIASRKGPVEPLYDQQERIEVVIPEAVRSDPHGKALAATRAEHEEMLSEARMRHERAALALTQAMEEEEAYRRANEGARWLHPTP